MAHPDDATRTRKNVVVALGNRALLERELGNLVHQLHRLAATDPARTDLETRRDGLLKLLDVNQDRPTSREQSG